jgi:CRISPR-associated protein Cas1
LKIFLDDFGIFLGRKRNRFVVKSRGEAKEIVADEVDSIICLSSGVSLSASALDLAVQKNIQVILAHHGGWPYAILMPASITGSVRARREQFKAYNDERGFALAKGFVSGKLLNQSNILKLMAKNRRQTDPRLAEELYESGILIEDLRRGVEELEAPNVDEGRQPLMNLEAEGARAYWGCLRMVLPQELGFEGRETRGARDPFNAMLNLGYQAALFPEVWKAVTYTGLDPYAGYLHADRPGKPSLVLDIMEEFRQQVVDRTLIGLLTKGTIRAGDLMAEDDAEGGRKLKREVVRELLKSFQERLEAEAIFKGEKSTIRGFIHIQARRVIRYLLEGEGYTPFHLGW